MDLLTYSFPGVDIPVVALLCFTVALLFFVITKAGPLGEAAGLLFAALGTGLALAGQADLVLLAAVELILLCAYLLIARAYPRKRGRKEEDA